MGRPLIDTDPFTPHTRADAGLRVCLATFSRMTRRHSSLSQRKTPMDHLQTRLEALEQQMHTVTCRLLLVRPHLWPGRARGAHLGTAAGYCT